MYSYNTKHSNRFWGSTSKSLLGSLLVELLYWYPQFISHFFTRGNNLTANVICNDRKPNGYGLYDMAGNVWEWVFDFYGSVYYANSPYENPSGPDSGLRRMLRGGGWNSYKLGIYVSDRGSYDPDISRDDHGFRCAVEL
jgi:formylglycine-generating enzyme required for sulfatase activity